MPSVLKVNEVQNTQNLTAMEIDSVGRITTPARPAFFATGASAYTAYTAYQKIAFNDVTSTGCFNIGGHFDTSTNQFTCPVAGIYFFSAGAINNTDSNVAILIKNNTANHAIRDYNTGRSATPNGLMQCDAGDVIEVQAEVAASLYLGQYGRFTGLLMG
jgi:hypothetical protein